MASVHSRWSKFATTPKIKDEDTSGSEQTLPILTRLLECTVDLLVHVHPGRHPPLVAKPDHGNTLLALGNPRLVHQLNGPVETVETINATAAEDLCFIGAQHDVTTLGSDPACCIDIRLTVLVQIQSNQMLRFQTQAGGQCQNAMPQILCAGVHEMRGTAPTELATMEAGACCREFREHRLRLQMVAQDSRASSTALTNREALISKAGRTTVSRTQGALGLWKNPVQIGRIWQWNSRSRDTLTFGR